MKILITFIFIFFYSFISAQTVMPVKLSLIKSDNLIKLRGRTSGVILDDKYVGKKFNFINSYISELYLDYSNKSNGIKYLTGKINDGETLLIFDENFDRDFDNDNIYLYKDNINEMNSNTLPIVSVKLKYDDSLIHFKPIPKPYFSNLNLSTGNLYIDSTKFYFEEVTSLKSDIFLNDNLYKITIINRFFSKYYDRKNSMFLISKNEITTSNEFIPLKDTFFLEGFKFYIQDINQLGDSLSYKIYQNNLNIGFKEDNYSYDFSSKNLVDGKIRGLQNIKSDFILLDFWGTWCKPCIELTPQIKNFQKKYSNRLQIISIAFENDTLKVVKYLKKNKINWINFIVNTENNKNNLINKFQIDTYPTFILIDKERKIIYREYGINGFNKLKKILSIKLQ